MANHVLNVLSLQKRINILSNNICLRLIRYNSTQSQTNEDKHNSELTSDKKEKTDFLPLNLMPQKMSARIERKSYFGEIRSPRYKKMKTNQKWSDVWPAARVFHPSTVPLPLHMGYTNRNSGEVPSGKYHNPELLKIPNFLHLTPPVIQKQCEALKRFCTEWPKGLETDEKCDKHFPIQIKTKEFVFSGTSIRWPDYRIVELQVKMSALPLDYHLKDKMKRLLTERYDEKTDTITITASKCPLRKQNYEYALYLLTAVYFESLKVEEWETEIAESDWEKYYWNQSKSKESIVSYMKRVKPDLKEEDILNDQKVKSFAESVCKLFDEKKVKQKKTNTDNYKQNVLQLLF
ncbi:28S ribosomal protein S35, mitochondrial-like [Oppia nitens]|uniref:28S ribosomal protein S35, mitochondrial-like n=1 Tax=Oppia nitens TaxID=1686743 RepID=UPI0023DBEC0B|nr:28S ribosomal protein S35, mitochondrial-like [Oppia nitens]